MDKNISDKNESEKIKKEIEEIHKKSFDFDKVIKKKEKELQEMYEIELKKINDEFEKINSNLKNFERMLKEDE
ncbi:MAG: hypothetical protein ACRC0Y_08160 [Fusobacteriaceae bacterium]